jgi:hypothetical protein
MLNLYGDNGDGYKELTTNYLPSQTMRPIAGDMTADPYAHPKLLWLQP